MLKVIILLVILYYVITSTYDYEEPFDNIVERCNRKIINHGSRNNLKLIDGEIVNLYDVFKSRYTIDFDSANYLLDINKYLIDNARSIEVIEILKKSIEGQLVILLFDYIKPIPIIIDKIEFNDKKESLINPDTSTKIQSLIKDLISKIRIYINSNNYKLSTEANNSYIPLSIIYTYNGTNYALDANLATSASDATATIYYGTAYDPNSASQKLYYSPVSGKLFGFDSAGNKRCLTLRVSGNTTFEHCRTNIGDNFQNLSFVPKTVNSNNEMLFNIASYQYSSRDNNTTSANSYIKYKIVIR